MVRQKNLTGQFLLPLEFQSYQAKYTEKWKKRNRLRTKQYERQVDLKREHGITIDEYSQLYEKQNGQCAICSATRGNSTSARLYVDHDHNLGKGSKSIRGLLCDRCNRDLRYFQDNSEFLLRASNYLEGLTSW